MSGVDKYSLLFSLRKNFLVVCFLATGLCGLDFSILALETAVLALGVHGFLHKGLRAVLLIDPRAEIFRGSFNDSTSLRESRQFALAIVLLVMSVWVKDRPHFNKLQVALELGSHIGFRKAKPVRARRGLIVLFLIS